MVSRDNSFPNTFAQAGQGRLVICSLLEATAVRHPAQSGCAESIHSFQDHFSRWKSSLKSWWLVFNKISRYISAKQESKKCRSSRDISFTLTSGALPYFLCVSWEVQVRHTCNSLALTEIHRLPAQHLACGVQSTKLLTSFVLRQGIYFVFDTLFPVIFIFSSKFKNILFDSQSAKEKNVWGWAVCSSSDWEGVRALGQLNFFNCAWKVLERLWCQESRLYT